MKPPTPKPPAWWARHSSGAWSIGKGETIGRVSLKTLNVGKSYSRRQPLSTIHPRTAATLVAVNRKQLGVPAEADW